jgi:hypothetical protein
MADLEEFFLEQIKPYEEKLQRLEELDKKKDVEISLLKSAIENMRSTIENLKLQLEKTKSGATAKPAVGAVKKLDPKKK